MRTESTPQIAMQMGKYSDGRPIQFKSIFLYDCGESCIRSIRKLQTYEGTCMRT